MEEIKDGEYVRSYLGTIGKVTKIDSNTNTKFLYEHKTLITIEKNVYKHSKNIIDLIEVGDYVNGYKVIGVTLDPAPSGKCVDIDCDKPSYESYLFEEQIYSIVTHEQFTSMEYKVKD